MRAKVPERIKVVVRASDAHRDVLTVQDAMRQVLDIFDLLAGDGDGVEWKLARATTNSPFYLEGEAVSLEPAVDVTVIARTQKLTLARNLQALASGEEPRDPAFQLATAKRLLARNLNGIGATSIDFEIGEPIVFTPPVARAALDALNTRAGQGLFAFTRPREEVGSVEGTFSVLGTYWGQPAIRILESNSRTYVWCRLNAELQPQFQDKATYSDIWHHRRVIVRGRIKYASDGGIDYVLASDIQRINASEIPAFALEDRAFTSGLTVTEYLDKFRDGTLG